MTISIKEKKENKKKWRLLVTTTIIGYLFGVFLTCIWFVYLSQNARCPLDKTKWITCVVVILLVLLLSYSRTIRCTVTLMLPILCSSKGRSLIVACAFVLATTGPTRNMFKNVDVLTKSLSCGQEQLKEALEDMLDVVNKPLVAIKNAVRIAMGELKKVLKRVQRVLLRIKEIVASILAVIKNTFNWLGSTVSVCNKELGTPFDRCMQIADDAMHHCSLKMGFMQGLCSVTNVFAALCYSVKFIDVLCVMVDFVSDSIIGDVVEKLQQFTDELNNMFSVSVTFEHDFEFQTFASRNLSDVGSDVVAEIHRRMTGVFFVFGWLDIIGGLLFLGVVIKAMYYKSKYLRNDHFDNNFITKDFIEINDQREKLDKELALPLAWNEEQQYLKLTALTLTRSEVFKMAKSMMFLTISSVQLFCICFADYSLYWLLSVISSNGRKEAGLDVPPFISVNISGGGFVGDIFHGIVHAFEPLTQNYTMDGTPCLPNPKEPDYQRYLKIAGLAIFAWMFVIFQPYALRVRQIIMRRFYPERSKQRALWLYNQIIMQRMDFVKIARRQARKKFLKGQPVDNFSCLDWIRAKTNRYWICRVIFGHGSMEYCVLCGTPLKGADDMIACQAVGCKGKYCNNCFKESNNMCCLCSSPIEYGDYSDVSEEKDSSDEFDEVRIPSNDKYCS